jgi:hypothetical protein
VDRSGCAWKVQSPHQTGPHPSQQRIEEVAERIVLLSDCAGQDVIDGFKDDIFDDVAWIL